VPVHGSVTAEGVLADLPGWSVVHDQPGIYRLVGPATGVVDDVPLWDAAADVTITPEGAGITEVRFTLDSEPVDTRFSFVGSVEG
jgi:hypothetical protein